MRLHSLYSQRLTNETGKLSLHNMPQTSRCPLPGLRAFSYQYNQVGSRAYNLEIK